MSTTNIYIAPQDGWTLIATAPGFLRVSAFPYNTPYHIWEDSSPPAATEMGGIYVCGKAFYEDKPSTNNFYARVINPTANSNVNGKLRLDIITGISGPPPSGNSIIMEDGSFILLEDGSKLLLE